MKKHEKVLERHAPVANVGIYYSDPTRMSYRKKSIEDDTFGSEMEGIEAVLMENHIPHDFILDYQVSKERLQKYNLVILPMSGSVHALAGSGTGASGGRIPV